MRSVSVRLADLENIKINLGYVGENEHVHILFDCKKAFDQYPNAVPSMVVVPPKGDSYPAVVTREGDIVEWVVTDSDLIYNGNGKIQLQFEQNDVVMKSAEARTFIAPSSIPTGTIPTPIQNWIAQANAILAEIPEDINSALAAAKASGEFDGDDGVGIASIAKTGTSGLVDTYTITLTNGNHYDIDVTNGTPGQNGVGIQNIAKTSTVGLVDTYTITLTNGQTYTFTVTNGQNGVEIDDTTPAVNKVFSSSKVDEEITDVKTAIQGKYTKPSDGIPAADLTQAAQNSLGAANSAYQKPSGGIPASDIADDVIPVVDSALSDSSENAIQNKVVKGALDTKAPVIINTATGNPAVFNDGCGMPLKSLSIPFTPKQTGSGDPSPSNIRPIVPWDGLKVWNGGTNLFDGEMELGTYNGNTGNKSNSSTRIRTKNAIPVKGGATYYFVTTRTTTFGISWLFYDKDDAFILNYNRADFGGGFDHAVPDNACYMRFSTWDNYGTEYGNDIGFNCPATEKTFVAYAPITETDISFPSPVYGGTLDAVTGVLTVEWAGFSAKWKDGINADNKGTVTRKTFTLPFTAVSPTSSAQGYCNVAGWKWNFESDDTHFYASGTNAYVFLPNDTDGETDIQIVGKLATPQEIQLTQEQITALVGNNTIWSDADGSMIVEYPADTALFIANQHRNFIAPELSSMIADTALVKNDFRIVGNNLYKITTAIASGGTLTPNTNCVKTTLAEVIKPLLT